MLDVRRPAKCLLKVQLLPCMNEGSMSARGKNGIEMMQLLTFCGVYLVVDLQHFLAVKAAHVLRSIELMSSVCVM